MSELPENPSELLKVRLQKPNGHNIFSLIPESTTIEWFKRNYHWIVLENDFHLTSSFSQDRFVAYVGNMHVFLLQEDFSCFDSNSIRWLLSIMDSIPSEKVSFKNNQEIDRPIY